MGLHEQKRRLTDQQRDLLQDQYRLVYAGINTLSKARSRKLTPDEVAECAKNVTRQFCTFNPEISKFSTYIYANCSFAVRNALKQRKTGKSIHNRSEVNLGGVTGTGFDQAKEVPYKEPMPDYIVSNLYEEIDALTPTMAACIKARIIDGKGYKEIAIEHNVSRSWAFELVKQGIARLKSRLDHWSDDEHTYPD